MRWISEIVADGSEIRSLAGRSAKLGDGLSRNPKDRDVILAQRMKDLEGLMGQVRGFNLDAFLSECSQTRFTEPWTLPSDSVPDRGAPSTGASTGSVNAARQTVMEAALSAGIPKKLYVLYAADYHGWALKQTLSGRLSLELRGLMPHLEVNYGLVAGPYKDDRGDGAYFAAGMHKLSETQLRLDVRRDISA